MCERREDIPPGMKRNHALSLKATHAFTKEKRSDRSTPFFAFPPVLFPSTLPHDSLFSRFNFLLFFFLLARQKQMHKMLQTKNKTHRGQKKKEKEKIRFKKESWKKKNQKKLENNKNNADTAPSTVNTSPTEQE